MASIDWARIWTTLVILVYGSSLVSCKRQKPRHDEIERVINVTHSLIWKCSVAECHPGSGLSFPCGGSIPFSESIECVYCVNGVNYSETNDYSQCKSCRKCSPHEKSSGHCTTTEDTTKCLKICDKGFYWNKITDSCDPCSDCCKQPLAQHERQCEDSGLPVSHQCQQTGVKCQHPTGTVKTNGKLFQPDDHKSNHRLSSSTITGIVVSCVLLVVIVIIALGFVIRKQCDRQQVRTILKRDCCFSQGKTKTVYSYNPKDNDADLESAPCSQENGSGPAGHLGEKNKKGLLTSVPSHPDLELPESPAGRDHEAKGNKKPRELCLPSVDNKDHSPANDLTVNSVSDFHGFQKNLLNRKMETIPSQPFYCNICTTLDVERPFWDDYRTFGEKIGLSRDEISLLGQKGQPTHYMLQRFKSQKNSSVGKFKNIMENMDRHDIVTIIDEWISFEWGKENNQAPH